MHLNLLFRFHVVPAWTAVVDALRRGPVVWAVALFVVGTLVWQTARGMPVVVLPADPPSAAALSLVGAVLVASVFSWPLVSRAARWQVFFSARPAGDRAWAVYAFARLLGSWAAAALVVAAFCGLAGWWGLLAGGLPFAAGGLALVRRPASSVPMPSGSKVPGVVAWWLSQPLLYLAPAALWVLLLVWALMGQAGFRWSDHPAAGVLLTDFGWSTVFGLFWSEAGAKVPWAYFRVARAPFRRVATVVGAPVAVATLVAAAVSASLAGSWPDALRAALLTLAGTAFWFGYWLRVGPSGVSVVVFATLVVGGVAADRDWWVLWGALEALGAAVVWSGWRTRYYEGEFHG